MGCGCGKKSTVQPLNFITGASQLSGEKTVVIGAQENVTLELATGNLFIRAGNTARIPENAANQLIADGVPIWILIP